MHEEGCKCIFIEKEVDKLTKIIDTYMQDRSLGAIEDIMNVSIFL